MPLRGTMPSEHEGLPPEFADRFTRPLRRFLRIESAAGLVLLAATIIALLVSTRRFRHPRPPSGTPRQGFTSVASS